MTADFNALRNRFDSSDMYGRILNFGDQMETAWEIGKEFAAGLNAGEFDKVVVCGMGGSAIGGDMARSFLGDRLNVPLINCRDYHLPTYLRGEKSLIIISSYSGNTAETLSALQSALGTGATIIAVTSGGKVAEICEAEGFPACIVPGGMPPRSALGFSLMPILQILRACGVAAFEDEEFTEALDTVRRRGEMFSIGSEENPAIELAESLDGGMPFIYAGPGLMEAVARRWSGQINENAKTLSHWAIYSELNHNEIVGWEKLEGLMDGIVVIAMEDKDDHAGTRDQMEVGLDIIEQLAGGLISINSGSEGRLARMMSMVNLGDFVSLYLAMMNEVDPTPVDKIDALKGQLK